MSDSRCIGCIKFEETLKKEIESYLKDYEVIPLTLVWNSVNQKLFGKHFFRFAPYNTFLKVVRQMEDFELDDNNRKYLIMKKK